MVRIDAEPNGADAVNAVAEEFSTAVPRWNGFWALYGVVIVRVPDGIPTSIDWDAGAAVGAVAVKTTGSDVESW